MSLSYDPLWKLLSELNISKMDFAKMVGMSNATLAKLGKNEPITLTTVDKICNRFNCKIENVVKHIPDMVIAQSNFIIEVGMIVLANDTSERELIPIEGIESSLYRTYMRPHIVLEAVCTDGEDDPAIVANTPYDELMYAVAPIYTSRTPGNSPLNVTFENVEIDGEITNGYVAFGRLSGMASGCFKKKLGVMPENYMQKFNKILQTFDEAFGDDED